MTELLIKILHSLIDRLEGGHSNLTEREAEFLIEQINKTTNQDQLLSTYEVFGYLNVSKTSFHEKIRPLLKGVKKAGHKSMYYTKKELDELKSTLHHSNIE